MEKMIPREYPSSRPHGFIGKQPRNSDEGPGVVCFGLKKKPGKTPNIHREEKLSRDIGLGGAFWREKSGISRDALGNGSRIPQGIFSPCRGCCILSQNPKNPAPPGPGDAKLFFPIFSILKSQHFRGKLPIIQHLSGATSALRDPCIPPIPKKSSIPKNRDIFLS